MLTNYFKIAWRNLKKSKIFSFINIFGLAIGLSCCMLISFYLHNELSYDSYHKNIDRLYQVGTTFIKDGKAERTANTPAPMARTMQQEFPEIEGSTRLLSTFLDDKTLLQYLEGNNNKSFYESKGYLADSNFFQLFTYTFKEGNPSKALVEPNCIVLSESIARKFFGNGTALNKVIHVNSSTNGEHDFRVTGIFAPNIKPSHIDAEFFMSMKGGEMEKFMDQATDLASNNMFYTYLLLKKGSNPKKLENKFPAFMEKYAGKDMKAVGFDKKQFLTAVNDVHLDASVERNVTPSSSRTYLYLLFSIALFTLLIACINFMNLSTARSSKRAAEVGVRKVLGAEKKMLVRQFLGESLFMSLIAFAVALALTFILLPMFAHVSGKPLSFNLSEHKYLLLGFLILTGLTGLVAGIYPAFYLSSFLPIKVLKGRITNSLAAIAFRKALVIIQFVISIVLIIASVIINNQMHYLRNKDLGFQKDQQIVIPLRSTTAKNVYPSLRNEIGHLPQVMSTGATLYYPGIINPSDVNLYVQGKNMHDSKDVFMNWVDENFLQTLGIKPVAGRLFSKDFPSDTSNRIIINEEGVKEFGFSSPKDAIGTNLVLDWKGQQYRYQVIGVIKDFHFKDLHSKIQPYGFQLNNVPQYNYIVAHTSNGNMGQLLRSIGHIWHSLNPNEPFEYSFLDQDFEKNYEADNRLTAIVSYFTIIAIIISCLGLFGLATFSSEQRTKEIGIRKVLGASVSNIVLLLSKDFLRLVAISVVVASPIAFLIMNKWLLDFAYRVPISWPIFLDAALASMLVAFITISFQAIKAALSNPVRNLRTE